MPLNNQPPAYNQQEETIRARLLVLQDLMEQREGARARNDQAAVSTLENIIVTTMRRIGDAYPEGETRREWHGRANDFERSDPEEREHILMPLAKGLGILIATPFALAGGIIFAAGAIVYGAGKTVMGLGQLLTGGVFR